MCFHVAPPSSDRYRPEPLSTGDPTTYRRCPFVCIATATLIRPLYRGSVVTSVHVRPSSLDLNNFAAAGGGPFAARPPPPNPPPAPRVVANIRFGALKS